MEPDRSAFSSVLNNTTAQQRRKRLEDRSMMDDKQHDLGLTEKAIPSVVLEGEEDI